MRPGAVAIDLAVETGGNIEGSQLDRIVEVGGVNVVGLGNLPSRVSRDASAMFSSNVTQLVADLWDQEANALKLDRDDEIIQSVLLTHEGSVVQERFR